MYLGNVAEKPADKKLEMIEVAEAAAVSYLIGVFFFNIRKPTECALLGASLEVLRQVIKQP